MKMDLVQRIGWINEMENKYPVDTYNVADIDIWPILRYHWHLRFKSPETYFKEVLWKEKPREWLQGVKTRMRKWKHEKKFQKSLGEKRKTDILIFSRESEYTEQVNGAWMNRYADPYIDFLPAGSWMKFECHSSEKSKNCKYQTNYFPFVDFKYEFLLAHPSFEEGMKKVVTDYFKLLPEEIKKEINLSMFVQGMMAIQYYRNYFTRILKHFRPDFILTVDYFSSDGFGLVVAARDCGVKSIDLQHGKQGVYHTMYTHFKKVGKNGFNTVPDYFFNWGVESAESIAQFSNTTNHHQPVVIGNPWISGWISKKYIGVDQSKIKNICGDKKIVLFSLQPVDDTLPKFVIEAINKSDEDVLWLMRFHPSMKISEKWFSEKGVSLSKIEFTMASEVPLLELLPFVKVHFTCWSSVCFEAALVGIHTVIVHPMGNKLYQKQINDGIFYSAENPEQCLSRVNDCEVESAPLTNYIICDENEIRSNINLFFKEHVG